VLLDASMNVRWMLAPLMLTVACASSATKPTTSAAMATTAHNPTTTAGAGPSCVDPIKDAIAKGQLGDENGVPYVLPVVHALDIDGDGKPDLVLELDRDGTTVRYEIYKQEGDCTKPIGSLAVPGTLSLGRGTVHGMRVLEVEGLCNEGCCRQIAHEELAFDGSEWVIQRTWYEAKTC
jgi:hypothetical protein